MNVVNAIRSAVDSEEVVFGTKETLKAVLTGGVKFAVFASNCNMESRVDLGRYAKLTGAEIHEFEGSGVELGELCGKPFVISMLAVLGATESKAKSAKPKRKKING